MIFGGPPIKPEDILDRVATEVPKAVKRICHGLPGLKQERNTAWTLAVKDVLASLALKHKGEPLLTSKEPKKSEFMLK